MNKNEFKKAMLEEVEKYDVILVAGHQRPDGDCYGSVLGMTELLNQKFQEKEIYPVLEENEFLKEITVGDFKDLDYLPENNFLLIVMDTSNIERIAYNYVGNADKIIKIDHHPEDNFFGELSYVSTDYASASEMVVDIFEDEIKNNAKTINLSKNILIGIFSDTARFLYDSTNEKTLYLSSLIYNKELDVKREIHDKFNTKKLNFSRLEGKIRYSFEKEENVAYYVIDNGEMSHFSLNSSEAANAVNAMSGIEGIDIWVLAIEDDEGFRLRIRSNKHNINEVAKKYSGGGHPLASGAKAKNVNEIKCIISDLKEIK